MPNERHRHDVGIGGGLGVDDRPHAVKLPHADPLAIRELDNAEPARLPTLDHLPGVRFIDDLGARGPKIGSSSSVRFAQVELALYTWPTRLIGRTLDARADAARRSRRT